MVRKVTVPYSLQLRRGTTADNDAYTGKEGEITVDTERESLRVHDGVTPGGWEVRSAATVLPPGGTTGQVLSKQSDADRDVGWRSVVIPTIIPAGTNMLFIQAAAPTGWTKVTDHNDKALRIVSGTGGGSGGSVAFSTAFASRAISGSVSNTTLAEWQMPWHQHINGHRHESGAAAVFGEVGVAGGNALDHINGTFGGSAVTDGRGSSGSHNHGLTMTALNMAVQYVDAIICKKD